MKKRLMIGVMAGGLMAAMLPGVVSAAPQPVTNTGQCVVIGDTDRAAFGSVETDGLDGPSANSRGIVKGPLNKGRAPFIASIACEVPNGFMP